MTDISVVNRNQQRYLISVGLLVENLTCSKDQMKGVDLFSPFRIILRINPDGWRSWLQTVVCKYKLLGRVATLPRSGRLLPLSDQRKLVSEEDFTPSRTEREGSSGSKTLQAEKPPTESKMSLKSRLRVRILTDFYRNMYFYFRFIEILLTSAGWNLIWSQTL